ncbi:MAG: hypothetical protein NPIRA02_24440 [Nitrospirales bacterium]|nr:MAG: hypothetical protein NPIRA02_24440 [Nitrospirales bacterium]
MLHQLLRATVCAMCVLLLNASLSVASHKTWTPRQVLALQHTVVKTKVNFPVRLTSGQWLTLAGFFYFKAKHVRSCIFAGSHSRLMRCLIQTNVGRKPVQTLIHGLTYDHRYWDIGRANNGNFSYARFMAKKGFVVLALDLLGSGQSPMPRGDSINITESTFTIAQVLFRLKSGNNPLGRAFKHVILVGHSLGGVLSVRTLGTFPHAADKLIVMAWAFAPHVVLPPDLVQAALVNPYVQLPSPVRTNLFYLPSQAEPRVIQFDNTFLADQTPRGIFRQGLPLLEAMARGNADDVTFTKNFSRSNRVRVPVLIQLGEFDVIAPARLARQEARFYPRAPRVNVQRLANIGHVFNFHVTNRKSWNGIVGWLHGSRDDDDDDDD